MSNSQPNIKIKILYFAKIKEILKKSSDTLAIEQTDIIQSISTSELMDLIISLNPEYTTRLQEVFVNTLFSLNDEYIERESNVQLKNGDEISVIPPISAG